MSEVLILLGQFSGGSLPPDTPWKRWGPIVAAVIVVLAVGGLLMWKLARRSFRFSLRTLLVLVAIVGGSLGWTVMQRKWIQDRHAAIGWIDKHGMLSHPPFEPREADAPLSLRIFGEPGVTGIWLYPEFAAEEARLRPLFPEAAFHHLETPKKSFDDPPFFRDAD